MTNKFNELPQQARLHMENAAKEINQAYSISFDDNVKLIRDTVEDFVVAGIYKPRRGKYKN